MTLKGENNKKKKTKSFKTQLYAGQREEEEGGERRTRKISADFNHYLNLFQQKSDKRFDDERR